MLELIDSHCHLDFPVFDANRSELIAQCKAAGINHFIVPGVDVDNWPRLVQLKEHYSTVSIAFGLHPYFIENHKEADLQQLESFCEKYNPIAIGEIGLDFYRKDLPREKQITFFEYQLAIAKGLELPVILHVRKAHQDIITFLKQFKLQGGIVHAFNGSYEQGLQYIDLGFKLGFGGALVNPAAKKLRSLAQTLPLDSILLETDSPDMKPLGFDGDFNTPLSILITLDVLSELRQEAKPELAQQILKNTKPFIS